MSLRGKSAVVTGGSRGIGRAIANRLLAEGVIVVTCGRGKRPEDLDPAICWVRADVARPEDAERIVAAGRPVDILVNNAGIQVEKSVIDTADMD